MLFFLWPWKAPCQMWEGDTGLTSARAQRPVRLQAQKQRGAPVPDKQPSLRGRLACIEASSTSVGSDPLPGTHCFSTSLICFSVWYQRICWEAGSWWFSVKYWFNWVLTFLTISVIIAITGPQPPSISVAMPYCTVYDMHYLYYCTCPFLC